VNWTGCYAAGGGYGMWNQDSYFEVTAPAVVPIKSNATNGEGGWFGVAGGTRRRLGRRRIWRFRFHASSRLVRGARYLIAADENER
jgi:hypothetical protein